MRRLIALLEYADLIGFVALAFVGVNLWRKRRDGSAGWVALTFVTLAAVLAIGRLTPEDVDSSTALWAQKLTIVLLVLFPYFLYRFMASLQRQPRAADVIAAAATAIVVVWALLLPAVPGEGEPRPGYFSAFIIALLIQWAGLLLLVALRMWRAGIGQASVVRWRMRMLSLGSLGMAVILIVAGTAPQDGSLALDLVVQLGLLVSAALFLIGFAPPPALRLTWRRPEASAMQDAIADLMTATSAQQMSEGLLPHITRMVGARGAALLDRGGGVIAAHAERVDPDELVRGLRERDERSKEGFEEVAFPFGRLVVWVSPYAPFFGREEFQLLITLGTMANLSLERITLFEAERRARRDLQESNASLARREMQLAQAQHVARLGSWEWDVKADTIHWTDELYRIFGIESENFRGTYDAFMSYVHPEDRDRLAGVVRKAIDEGGSFAIEHRVVRADGEERIVLANGRAVRGDDGDIERLIGTAQDITERVRRQRETEEYERRIKEVQLRQQQALQINDNIVQGLTVAKYAHEMGRHDQAEEALDRTLAAARRIITDLLEERGEGDLGPGDLVREQAAIVTRSAPTESGETAG